MQSLETKSLKCAWGKYLYMFLKACREKWNGVDLKWLLPRLGGLLLNSVGIELKQNSLLKIWFRISFHDGDLAELLTSESSLLRALLWMLHLSRTHSPSDFCSKVKQRNIY